MDTKGRSAARDLLVRALYQWQIAGHDEAELADQFGARSEHARCDAEYFAALLKHSIDGAEAADRIIARHASRALEQLDAVGRAVLLLALAELQYRPDVPRNVVINEAVTLAKRYGATDSFRFVNALLDKAARDVRPPEAASGE